MQPRRHPIAPPLRQVASSPITPLSAANCTPTIHLLLQSTSDSHGSQTLSAPPPEYASSRTYRRPNPAPNGRPTDRLSGRSTSGPPFGRNPAALSCLLRHFVASKPKSRPNRVNRGRGLDSKVAMATGSCFGSRFVAIWVALRVAI